MDTNHHIGEDYFLGYEEIYKIFNSTYFPADDENLGVYHNILRTDIHIVVSQPSLFPYNVVVQWCFKKFDITETTIVRK